MLRFLDGPAGPADPSGTGLCVARLSVARAPLYLRVVRSAAGQWDALDQPDDTPAVGETVYAYRREGAASSMFLDYTDAVTRRRKGKCLVVASYRLCRPQPDAATLNDGDAWRRWATDQRDAERAAQAGPAAGTPPAKEGTP